MLRDVKNKLTSFVPLTRFKKVGGVADNLILL